MRIKTLTCIYEKYVRMIHLGTFLMCLCDQSPARRKSWAPLSSRLLCVARTTQIKRWMNNYQCGGIISCHHCSISRCVTHASWNNLPHAHASCRFPPRTLSTAHVAPNVIRDLRLATVWLTLIHWQVTVLLSARASSWNGFCRRTSRRRGVSLSVSKPNPILKPASTCSKQKQTPAMQHVWSPRSTSPKIQRQLLLPRTFDKRWVALCDGVSQGWPTCLRLGSTRKYLDHSRSTSR